MTGKASRPPACPPGRACPHRNTEWQAGEGILVCQECGAAVDPEDMFDYWVGEGEDPGDPAASDPNQQRQDAGPLLRQAQNEQAAAKVGVFGGQGSGKSTTVALLAIGLSKTYHNGAPVAMHDTENGGDYLAPLFEVEGVPLLLRKSRAFRDMTGVLDEAERAGCCALVVDSITHPWNELVESYCQRLKVHRMEFHHWKEIKSAWRGWVERYLNSPLHGLLAARAGYEGESQENGEGKKRRSKGATRLRVAGEFGYEASLLIEMEAVRGDFPPRHRGGMFLHYAHVLKDRTRSLQGKTFIFRDRNAYKPGDWRKVFEKFRPHFGFLNIGGVQRALERSTSAGLFDETGSEGWRRAEAKKIALEEISNLLGVLLWPGQDVESKRIRLAVLERLWGVRAWAAVEAMPLDEVERGLFVLLEYEKAARGREPSGKEEILQLLKACQCRAEP